MHTTIPAIIRVDAYILDTLMADLVGHDRKPSAFIVYLHLFGIAQRTRRDTVGQSLQTIATETGLSKSSVQSAIRHLQRRHLVEEVDRATTSVPLRRIRRPWLPASRRG